MLAFIQLHAVILVSILSAVVAVDHALASTDLIKSSSTGQAIIATVGKVGEWLLAIVSPKA